MKRTMVLVAMLMTVVLVLLAPMAEAKKHHHKLNTVQCPTEADFFTCNGTAGNDSLVGTPNHDNMFGGEGNDVYQPNGGGGVIDTNLNDESTTSSDTYVFEGPDLGKNFVKDCGGGSDTVDLSSTSFRLLDNVTNIRAKGASGCFGADADDLTLTGPEGRVTIVDQFGDGKIETIKFANGTLTF